AAGPEPPGWQEQPGSRRPLADRAPLTGGSGSGKAKIRRNPRISCDFRAISAVDAGRMRSFSFHGIILGAAGSCLAADPAPLDDRWKNEVLPLMETYCYDCHGDGLRKGELAIDRYGSIEEMQRHRDVWKRIRDHIRHQ